ncbi:ADP-ribosylglycohydrolase family protein [Dysgonomonas sp. Marseille-P4677]|uniref:ADP-ribosylglycohydrolase family protein n=1 Tax=Dysgonomonas sp. Marseille-P4677 TaxID=2364790 RepID=UPI00191434B0|nr:ADP-ribosylglycohydrolase family protein [Dysgonomonas sp. Marseille-P4677]MBK5721431.1 ADP-ribosylglycohydrolase family protein [Dysgonomonas sp. Marseille-P4677]
MNSKLIHSALFGIAVGDALGVPVEFRDRKYLKANPVMDMLAYGTHNQPAGTWSDDSSLTFCLAETLVEGYSLKQLSNRFINWYEYGYWTPHGEMFDVGTATSKAIYRLEQGINPVMAGGSDESDNGNGSLMRILPLLFYIKEMKIKDRFRYVSDVSSLTHRHIRSVLGCFIYIEFALQLLKGVDRFEAFLQTKDTVNDFLNNNPICSDNEIKKYCRILMNPIGDYEIKPIYEYTEDKIESSGYVVHSFEAALWCIFKENNFEDTVLRAVNLGSDTDTTAAIAGGLAGLLYGFDAIPQKWIDQLARKDDIYNLCERLKKKLKQ